MKFEWLIYGAKPKVKPFSKSNKIFSQNGGTARKKEDIIEQEED